MFGQHSKGFVQMCEYGCRNTVMGGLDAALDQMERRVHLWNRFVEIERGIRQRARALLSDDAEYREIHEIQGRLASLRAALRQLRRAGGLRRLRIRGSQKQSACGQSGFSNFEGARNAEQKRTLRQCESCFETIAGGARSTIQAGRA
jgi:hypothetical protein